ncbi:hypothetical protein [Tepidibacter formicigenes]|jgi:hypothetical protein|uniref:Uncharacterized protein n=1 Tax=Tepidibacter formicigenes DSM 15518 TaxID=1123349 RepID=A0A1M6T339_9FIRM|nr:hypothetical protein [Tepidibacter formicigenes]SHK51423.1 hypothetical protein SAMN02744037_02496 [Tepidibacter formicigenes DSM 15518]
MPKNSKKAKGKVNAKKATENMGLEFGSELGAEELEARRNNPNGKQKRGKRK